MVPDTQDPWVQWHSPTSTRDLFSQLCTNIPRTIALFLGSIGEWVWKTIIQRLFICRRFKRPHQTIEANMFKKSSDKPPAVPMSSLRKRTPLDLNRGKVIDQMESMLYYKLPLEIRSLIFEFVLFGEGNVVHVYKRRKAITHFRCKSQRNGQPCTYADPCSPALPYRTVSRPYVDTIFSTTSLARFYDSSRFEKDEAWGVVSLMRTCRRIYEEVVPMLYVKTHFHFPHPTDLALFSTRVVGKGERVLHTGIGSDDSKASSFLESIRIMSFDVGDFDTGFSVDAADDVPEGTATVSSGLTGLKELRVFVKKIILVNSNISMPGGQGAVNTGGVGGVAAAGPLGMGNVQHQTTAVGTPGFMGGMAMSAGGWQAGRQSDWSGGRGESIGGLVLGCNIKEREGLDVFQVIVPEVQYRLWEGLLKEKRGIDLCVYRDETVPLPEEDSGPRESGDGAG